MLRGTHALFHCVAVFSLLCYGNAAKGPAPPEVLTHFARTVGTVFVPVIHANQAQQQQEQQPQEQKQPQQKNQTEDTQAPIRRQVGSRQATLQDEEDAPPVQSTPNSLGAQQYSGQGFPFQLGANFRQPYQQHQNYLYPGAGVGPFDGQPDLRLHGLDPRLLQQFQNLGPLGQIQHGIPKPINPLGSSLNSINGNLKDTGSVNINSIQDGDSKSSAQNNRPFEPLDFQLNPAGNTVGVGGNYNRFGSGTFGYQNVRQQSYYGDSPGNGGGGGGGGQRNNFYNNFNDIGGSYPGGNGGGGGGSPYQYANLNYNGAGYAGAGGYAGGYGSGNGLSGLGGESYFGNNNNFFGQNPYQSLGFNSLPGGGAGGADGGQGFPGNFQSPFGGGFPGAGGGNFPGGAAGFFPQGGGQGVNGLGVFGVAGSGTELSGASLRPAKETAASTQEVTRNDQGSSTDNQQNLRFLHAKRRNVGTDKTRSAAIKRS